MTRSVDDAQLFEKIRSVTINRRRLVQGAAASGALVFGGRHAVTPALASSRRLAQEGAPTPGGVLRVATSTDPVGLDPMISSAYSTALITEHVYGSLMQYDKELNEVLPDLAESVEISDDRLLYTFTLREGVLWHDGQPFTAEDVKFSMERQQNPDTGSPNAYMYAEVAEVTVVDPLTVEVRLNQVQGPFLAFMSSPWASMVPKHVVEEHGDLQTVMVGTGPFKFVSYTPGSSVKMVKNPDYYVEGQPLVDELEIVFITDATSRLNAVLSKQVDLAQDIAKKDYQQLSAMPGVQVIALESGSCNWDYIGVNVTRAPFDNLLVRQAVAHAINRQAIVDNVMFGLAMPLTGGILPPWSWAHTEGLELYSATPDVEQAKALLTEAGFPDGFETTIKVSPAYPDLASQAAINQEALRAVGINAQIVNLEWGTFINDVFGADHNFDMQVCGWGGPFIDPDEFLYPEFHSDQGFNPQLFADPEVDALLEEGRTTFEREGRAEIYAQVQEMILTRAPIAATTNNRLVQAQQEYVQGFTALPTGMMRWVREVWLDK